MKNKKIEETKIIDLEACVNSEEPICKDGCDGYNYNCPEYISFKEYYKINGGIKWEKKY